jgi:RimJ/RimL family protein N-acetyltransferase
VSNESPVVLEPVALHHAPALQELASDPAIAATSNVPSPYPPDGAVAFVREAEVQRAAGTDFVFAVTAGGEVVGACGLHSVRDVPRRAELGYWIGRPYWGRGYASAAARQAVAWGFGELGLEEIHSSALERNPASRRVLGRTGFRPTGVGGNPNPKWGPEDRFVLVRLTRAEWERARGFADYFSGHAADYAAHRPGYPPDLFDLLALLPRERRLAWDCGTGNGQAAVGLAAHFERVIATDASPEQLAHAAPHPRVEYRLAPAEAAGLPDAAADLVTAAQALHWFSFDGFYAEVRRVLAPGGAVAVWTYNLARVDPDVDRVIDRLAYEIVKPYWPPERRWVDEEYRTIPFPFAEIPLPPLAQEEPWDLDRLLRYLATWSACQNYRRATGRNPVDEVGAELASLWGPEPLRTVRWPIFIRAGKLPPA